ETARILLDRIGPEIPLETMPELAPSCAETELLAALRAGATVDHVVAIGHQPLLGQLAGVLTGDQSTRFPPGSMVWIEFPGTPAPNEGRHVRSVAPGDLG